MINMQSRRFNPAIDNRFDAINLKIFLIMSNVPDIYNENT